MNYDWFFKILFFIFVLLLKWRYICKSLKFKVWNFLIENRNNILFQLFIYKDQTVYSYRITKKKITTKLHKEKIYESLFLRKDKNLYSGCQFEHCLIFCVVCWTVTLTRFSSTLDWPLALYPLFKFRLAYHTRCWKLLSSATEVSCKEKCASTYQEL